MLHLYNSGRVCGNCGELKPDDAFLGPKDSTCKLCRKAITEKRRVYTNLQISHEILLGDMMCSTCGKQYTLKDFPPHSLECRHCWISRCYVEYFQRTNTEAKAVCLVCEKSKPVTEFPSGGLICKTCIYTANSYRRKR